MNLVPKSCQVHQSHFMFEHGLSDLDKCFIEVWNSSQTLAIGLFRVKLKRLKLHGLKKRPFIQKSDGNSDFERTSFDEELYFFSVLFPMHFFCETSNDL